MYKKELDEEMHCHPDYLTVLSKEIFEGLNWEKRGFNINGEYLNNLRFVDDVALIAKNNKEVHTVIKELISQEKETGMLINAQKTKILNKKKDGNIIKIMNKEIENMEEVIYLGQLNSFEDSTKKK